MPNSKKSDSRKDQNLGFEGSSLYHLSKFKSLPIEQKFLAVEQMCEVESFFKSKRKQ